VRPKAFFLAAGSVPLFAACSFLLDFNGLQGGHKARLDAGSDADTGNAEAGSGGAGGSDNNGSGAGAAGSCDASSCDDSDPCTVDTCDPTSHGCMHAPSEGLGLELDFAPLLADSQVRVTLTAGSDAFYFSNLSTTGSQSEVEIFRLGEDEDAYTSLKKLSSFAAFTGEPASVAGLAVDTSSALGESLHGLVAVKNAAGDAQVWQIVADSSGRFGLPSKVGDSYSQALSYNYPVARSLNGVVHGAWINADGSISVLSPSSTSPAKFGSAAIPAGVLTLIGTDTYQPAVIFSSQTNGVYLETAGANRTAMPECQTAAGGYLSMSATALAGHNGIWFSSWTKYTTDALTSESHLAVCANGSCQPDTTSKCKSGDDNNLQRDTATESVHLPGDPAEQSYAISVVPVVSPDPDAGTADASLVAVVARLSSPLDKNGSSTEIGTPLTLASLPAAPTAFRGPDFPALAVLPGAQVKVAVAWIQPAAGGSGQDELHLQRYRLCLAK
jgi:hypothetical protein